MPKKRKSKSSKVTNSNNQTIKNTINIDTHKKSKRKSKPKYNPKPKEGVSSVNIGPPPTQITYSRPSGYDLNPFGSREIANRESIHRPPINFASATGSTTRASEVPTAPPVFRNPERSFTTPKKPVKVETDEPFYDSDFSALNSVQNKLNDYKKARDRLRKGAQVIYTNEFTKGDAASLAVDEDEEYSPLPKAFESSEEDINERFEATQPTENFESHEPTHATEPFEEQEAITEPNTEHRHIGIRHLNREGQQILNHIHNDLSKLKALIRNINETEGREVINIEGIKGKEKLTRKLKKYFFDNPDKAIQYYDQAS